MERRGPRNNTRSNPVIVPTMRSLCRVKKRFMILFRLTFRDKHIMREEVMERHSFLVAALLLRVLRVFVVKWFSALLSPLLHGAALSRNQSKKPCVPARES